ncbi:probable G-protein coupled receptor CG31760 [Anneissia japonica]|uniref:probable G-protein coupled receptor CG31760 n=1 Tax=Anneissia japonica TaxID=1529436 RepID=UPI00142567A6|nr:probable G-protein coupled receptor CG31760 [Anneissia japonica]
MKWSTCRLVFLFLAIVKTSASTFDYDSIGYNATKTEDFEYFQDNITTTESPRLPITNSSNTVTSDDTDKRQNNNQVHIDVVSKFLQRMEDIERNVANCEKGTDVTLDRGAVTYGPKMFRRHAMVAVHRANLLTRIWKNSSIYSQLENNELFFYSLVVSVVENNPDIFAFGNCHDRSQFGNYTAFCPFAYRQSNGMILVKDLSVSYHYLTNQSEFFWEARQKAEELLKTRKPMKVEFAFRFNDTAHQETYLDEYIMVRYEDGHWSPPYFDCGGGYIWMMTYTIPFLGMAENGTYFFKGTSGIDIDLRDIDIDQCPVGENASDTEVDNVFAGSDKCHRKTQTCKFVPGRGFRRGSYVCICNKGFYFPNETAEERFYNGSDIEEEFRKYAWGLNNVYMQLNCLPCGQGCDECTNDQPCIFSYNWALRNTLLAVDCIAITGLFALFYFTIANRNLKVVKAASPMLLRIILFGSLLLYCRVLAGYSELTSTKCILQKWFQVVGFATSYGALLLKTWRIAVVFKVQSALRVRITDADLIKRLCVIQIVFIGYLVARTAISPPKVITVQSMSGVKSMQCSSDWWDHAGTLAELLFLLWGVRLCYNVRKAPSEFNESRFISWAIYNETLLSVFSGIAFALAKTVICYIYMVYKGKGDVIDTKFKTTMTQISHHRASVGDVSWSRLPRGYPSSVAPTSRTDNMEKSDIQVELRRLYMQLEILREKSMRLGNPHLKHELAAAAEASKALASVQTCKKNHQSLESLGLHEELQPLNGEVNCIEGQSSLLDNNCNYDNL